VTLRKLVETFSRVGGKAIHAEWGAFSYRDREVMAPWEGGETITGWGPSVSLEEGIRRYIDSASGIAK
jgi:nucleoside-diphosphate-sugar epimerase